LKVGPWQERWSAKSGELAFWIVLQRLLRDWQKLVQRCLLGALASIRKEQWRQQQVERAFCWSYAWQNPETSLSRLALWRLLRDWQKLVQRCSLVTLASIRKAQGRQRQDERAFRRPRAYPSPESSLSWLVLQRLLRDWQKLVQRCSLAALASLRKEQGRQQQVEKRKKPPWEPIALCRVQSLRSAGRARELEAGEALGL